MKQYFLVMDALMPVEWSVHVFHGAKLPSRLPFLKKHFERVVAVDAFKTLGNDAKDFYAKNAKDLYFSASSSILENLKAASAFDFAGADELLIPEKEFRASGKELIAAIKDFLAKRPIRRVDITVENPASTLDKASVQELREACEAKKTGFFITTREDFPEDEWYSKPGEEAIVDSDPMPYHEGDKVFSVAANPIYYHDGFFLHLNDGPPTGKTFYDGDDAWKLLVSMLEEKKRVYAGFADGIKQRDGNVYYTYFDWVKKNVSVRGDCNFIPSFMMRPTTAYARALVENGALLTNLGIVKPDTKTPHCIAEIKDN